jgi:hypothetical protein
MYQDQKDACGGTKSIGQREELRVTINVCVDKPNATMVCSHMEAFRMKHGIVLQCPVYCQRDCILLIGIANEQARKQAMKEEI